MTVDVSKQATYVVLQGTTLDVSKQVTYVALRPADRLDVSKQVTYVVLFEAPSGFLLLPRIYAEPITGGDPSVRLPRIYAAAVTGGNPSVRLPKIEAEVVAGGNPSIRCPLIGIEVFYALPQEVPVATDVLPTRQAFQAPLTVQPLPGLGWSVHRKPNFRTQINSAVTGKETRTARMQYPIWEFELTFEYLDQRGSNTQLNTLLGFFLNQQGAWGAWLFQDWTNYLLTQQFLGVADGGTTGFTVVHTIGGYTMPIGQFDLTDLFTFSPDDVDVMANEIDVGDHGLTTGFGPLQLTTAGTLPAGLDVDTNYWIIRVDDDTIQLALSPADAASGTEVTITDAGMGTFTAANSVAVFVDETEIDPTDYVVTMPNQIVFDSAPSMGNVSVSCKYFFVCRFTDDVQDFEEFMDRLNTLDTLTFQSIPYEGQQ